MKNKEDLYFRVGKGQYLKSSFEGKTDKEMLEFYAGKRKVKGPNGKMIQVVRMNPGKAQTVVNKALELGLLNKYVKVTIEPTKESNTDQHGQDI